MARTQLSITFLGGSSHEDPDTPVASFTGIELSLNASRTLAFAFDHSPVFVEAPVCLCLHQLCFPLPGAPYLKAPHNAECGDQDKAHHINPFQRCDFCKGFVSCFYQAHAN